MKVLLDTNALLWLLADDARLGKKARATLAAADAVYFSVASLWEIAIKISIGKLPANLLSAITDGAEKAGLAELAIKRDHLALVAAIPLHHKDPFDRLLIAQATAEPLYLITSDRALEAYQKSTIVNIIFID
jgi:PIN domain nuclease of toxin-antitoxin system